MHDFNLKITKILLIVLMVAIIFGMVSGISALKNTFYWRTPYFVMQLDYLKEKLAFMSYMREASGNSILSAQGNSTEKAKSIPILLYHGVIKDSNWKSDDVNMSLNDFQAQMFALKKAGYQTIKLQDYLDFMTGKKQLPAKSFMLTFDDGRKDSFYPVDPIFRVLGYSAVMNVITGRSLGPENEKGSFHLSQIELQKMAESGRWEMASHTQNGHDYEKISSTDNSGHFLSDKLWLASENRLETDAEYAQRVGTDLANSKQDIEKYLQVKPLAFAYPFGDFGQESINYPGSQTVLTEVLHELFPITFYQTRGSEYMNNYPSNPFMTRRIDMKSEVNVSSEVGAEKLVELMNNDMEKSLDYTDNFTKNNGWLQGWGQLTFNKNRMTISDSPTDDSGMTFLGGTFLWKDYISQVRVSLPKGGAFALVARYQNEDNYVACDFTDFHVAFAQRANGVDEPDREQLIQTNLNSGRIADVGVSVQGDKAICYLDGKPAATGVVERGLENGGVGIKMWDLNSKKGSLLIVSDLKVTGNVPAVIQ
jgi:peptidoglycan/xylan/chitin deacetylase (PgdA/CDA1 family)